MKKIVLLTSVFALVATTAFSQSKPGKTVTTTPTTRNCGTMEHLEWQKSKDPTLKARMEADEFLLEENIKKPASQNNQKAITYIPVVVHVVWRTAAENISDAQVQSQIDVLNEDFGRTNADTGNTPAAFAGLAAGGDIRFCLAAQDPNGLPTNGINRVNTTVTSFTTDDKVKFTAQGGANAWDVTQYLNIWVCNLGGGVLGYAEFPTSTPSNTYGVVNLYNAFGRVGTVSAPFNLGRTMSHEFAHCFSLYHIWGDDGSACSGTDQVADTPNQAGPTYGCPSFPTTDACTASSPGVMFMNYMDYSDDVCMNMFTQGQQTRAWNSISTFYPSLLTSNKCTPVSTANDDAGILSITSPSGNICSGTINPVVVLRNYGSNILTSVTINYLIDGIAQTPYTWAGNLATNATATVNLPAATVASGAHTFNANTTMPNGVTDGTPANDAAPQKNFTIVLGGAALPYIQGFEGTFLPAGMTANNPDAATTWAKTTVAAKTGSASAFMDYYNYSTSKGQPDEIITPAVDLTSVTNPQLTFELAYRLYTDPNGPGPYFSDTLQVLISTNCGATWTSLYRKENIALTTATPVFSTASFVPTSNQWRKETISLSAYSSATNAMIMFRGIGDYENQMYIDDINIDFATGINDVSNNTDINIFPNPATDYINVLLTNLTKTKIEIFNVIGGLVYSETVLSNINKIDMSTQPNGVYFVKVTTDGVVTTKKVLVSK